MSTPVFPVAPKQPVPHRNAFTQTRDSTPQNIGVAAQANLADNPKADALNVYLEEDLKDRVIIPGADFLTVILGSDKDQTNLKSIKDDKAFKKAWRKFIKTARTKVPEKELYGPLIESMDLATRAVFGQKPPLFFLDGSGKIINGSLVARKPDIDALNFDDVVSEEVETMEISWAMLIWWLEVKHHNGQSLDRSGKIVAGPQDGFSMNQNSRRIKALPKSGRVGTSSSKHTTSQPGPSHFDTEATNSSKRKKSTGTVARNRHSASTALTSSNLSVPEPTTSIQSLADVVVSQPPGKHTDNDADEEDGGNDRKRQKNGKGKAVVPEIGGEIPSEQEARLPDTDARLHTRLQCAGYGLEMLSSGIIRYHSLGIIIDSTWIQMAYFDRSKIVLSNPLNMSTAEGLDFFLSVLLQLCELSSPHIGLSLTHSPFPEIKPSFNPSYIHDKDSKLDFPGEKAFHGCTLTLAKDHEVILGDVVYRARSIIGRGTIVLRGKCQWSEQDVIVKISFPGKGREAEDKLIEAATQKAKEIGHVWVLNHLPQILWSGMFPPSEDMPECRLANYLHANGIDYEERVMRVTIQDVLHPLTELLDPKEYAQTFFDVLQVHRWLVDHPKVLHRDISMANIMYRKVDGKVYGVLNDYDLASSLPLSQIPSSAQRTGTKPYMSHELLEPKSKMRHLYRHDLEALFYVILILCSHYGKPDSELVLERLSRNRPYDEWFSANNEYVAKSKSYFLGGGDHLGVTEFFVTFKNYLIDLRDQLGEGYNMKRQYRSRLDKYKTLKQEDEQLDLPFEKTSPPAPLDWHTLNGCVTYDTFKQVMEKFRRQPLITRYEENLPLDEHDFVLGLGQD